MMISPFDLAEPVGDVVDVMPLEFVSLDEPLVRPADELRAELEAAWRARVDELELRLEEQGRSSQAMLDALRHEADVERVSAAEQAERDLADVRLQVAKTVERFAGERDRYFKDVEREVVQLALAIAERVLHREAAMDPTLLQAAVRVALERVAGEGKATLRVAKDDVDAWSNMFGSESKDGVVDVLTDESLSRGDAVLETSVGRVDLGVREQLREIERGFFDLLAMRPA